LIKHQSLTLIQNFVLMKISNIIVLGALMAAPLQAATFIVSDTVAGTIPDGSSSGIARLLNVSAPGETITDVEVDLSLAAFGGDSAFLGDLYIYLSHGSELSVLLNRPGRTTTATAGYGDDQPVNVTLATSGASDIHNYRLALGGSATTPLTGPLTGTWQADGRAVDPSTVLDTSPRTAGLDVFIGDAASGAWNLFAADLSTGAQHQITGWTLRITTVPEPSSAMLLLAVTPLLMRRRR
jgi:subtilisin-like proprotein convertase family protein